MRVLIGAMGLALLAGCATSPISAEKAKPVPADRVYSFQAEAESQLVVTRDSGLQGSGCKLRFHIDGKAAADFYAAEVARFGVPAGKHIIAVEPVGICGGSGIYEAEVTLAKGESVRRRISGIGVYPTAF
ncbi:MULTISPECIES: hypothetical protein [unclassified Pseudomonas]|uniref:hypothetical protein n=1 Tax=unclassified Pseudomonas TaxID=196821 RepID=UPI0021BB5C9E|nr:MULTISPECIES: hypothetical protein [unclassified Pseudomonas]MCT8165018.1 hypothetical protein [Pseudomonas sp. HD6422]MCT8183916.1 hypothetical protein [Pseudomonas sp. HD6421]